MPDLLAVRHAGAAGMSLSRIYALTTLLVMVPAAAVSAAPRVELEIVTDPEFSSLETQNWHRLFEELKLTSVRIRGGRSTDTVQVVTAGSKASPLYPGTGMLNGRNELVLPGGQITLR